MLRCDLCPRPCAASRDRADRGDRVHRGAGHARWTQKHPRIHRRLDAQCLRGRRCDDCGVRGQPLGARCHADRLSRSASDRTRRQRAGIPRPAAQARPSGPRTGRQGLARRGHPWTGRGRVHRGRGSGVARHRGCGSAVLRSTDTTTWRLLGVSAVVLVSTSTYAVAHVLAGREPNAPPRGWGTSNGRSRPTARPSSTTWCWEPVRIW